MSNIVSKFYGMIVLMSKESDSKPHFEVIYDGEVSKFSIADGRMYEGNLISDGQDIIRDWYNTNLHLLRENWRLLSQNQKLKPIPPIL